MRGMWTWKTKTLLIHGVVSLYRLCWDYNDDDGGGGGGDDDSDAVRLIA